MHRLKELYSFWVEGKCQKLVSTRFQTKWWTRAHHQALFEDFHGLSVCLNMTRFIEFLWWKHSLLAYNLMLLWNKKAWIILLSTVSPDFWHIFNLHILLSFLNGQICLANSIIEAYMYLFKNFSYSLIVFGGKKITQPEVHRVDLAQSIRTFEKKSFHIKMNIRIFYHLLMPVL